ncbi:MAG: PrpR N-terminal domain-containing protein [Oscillospiraceae bacterium]
MKKLRLLCVAPYEGMYHLMTNIAAQRNDIEMIVQIGNLDEGLRALLDMQGEDIDAVLSRGGTADAIRPYCKIPIYDVVPSVYDILRTINVAQGVSEQFAVVAYPSITKAAEVLKDIMRLTFNVYTIQSAQECEKQIRQLKENGIHLIVGDTIAVSSAQSIGMHGLLIVSGIEGIDLAIDSIKQTYGYCQSFSRDAQLFSDVLRQGEDETTVIYSSEGVEVFSSNCDIPEKIVLVLQQKFSNVIASGEVKMIRHFDDELWTICGSHVRSADEDYCVYRLRRQPSADMIDRHMIRYLSSAGDMQDCNPLEYYLGSSEDISAVRCSCDHYATINHPVLLLGESGTGKDRFAHYIYSHSKLKNSAFVIADCGLMDEKAWSYLLGESESPFMKSGISIYIKHLEMAPIEQQHRLLAYLKSSRVAYINRLYFSYTLGLRHEVNDELYVYLSDELRCLKLRIPPLSERRIDIPAMVGLYINTMNIEYGTRVFGLVPDALLELQNHTWKRNVDQLVQVVQSLVLNAKASYISQEDVRTWLTDERVEISDLLGYDLDLDRPLDDIIKEVVERVYKSENMNQTQTAKHLNISRSTVWRILKS